MSNAGRSSSGSKSSVLDKGNLVQVIGRGTNIKFVLDQSAPVESLESELRAYLGKSRGWFRGGKVLVDAGRKVLKPIELQRLRSIFEDEYKINVANFECPATALEDAFLEDYNVPVSLVQEGNQGAKASEPTPASTLLVRSNCRSGRVLKHPGDVVIFGDVNPGGKVIADGDVVVLGAVRGMVHAGAKDTEDSDASIIAFQLGSARLLIGTHLYQHATGKNKNGEVPLPVIARVRRGGVEVKPYTGSLQSKKERKPQWQEKRM
jgi:septum site-determining protein MinC